MADERFDGLFMNVAQQAHGIEPLMDHMFSFLRRKTDFFTGASRTQVEELVMKSLGKQADIADKEAVKRKAAKEGETRPLRGESYQDPSEDRVLDLDLVPLSALASQSHLRQLPH